MTAADVTGFDAIFSTGFFATFSGFQGLVLRNCTQYILEPVDVSDIFYFFLLGEWEGGVRGARSGGGRFLLKIPGGGVSPRTGRAERPGGWNWGILFWGGGLNIFCSGRNVHQAKIPGGETTQKKMCFWVSIIVNPVGVCHKSENCSKIL